MACTESVPGLAHIAEAIPEALDELRTAAGLGPATAAGMASEAVNRPPSAVGQERRRGVVESGIPGTENDGEPGSEAARPGRRTLPSATVADRSRFAGGQ